MLVSMRDLQRKRDVRRYVEQRILSARGCVAAGQEERFDTHISEVSGLLDGMLRRYSITANMIGLCVLVALAGMTMEALRRRP